MRGVRRTLGSGHRGDELQVVLLKLCWSSGVENGGAAGELELC